MKTIHILISGPIRPSINYLNHLIKIIKSFINFETKLYLCYWNEININNNLIKNIDYFFPEIEPNNDFLFQIIKSRTIQQQQSKLEDWTPRMFKMFYGIKLMIDNINFNKLIHNNDIILRVRTDLFIDSCVISSLHQLLNNINSNSYYLCPRMSGNNSCDWFGISTFEIFKKIWYFNNINEYNKIIQNVYNAESIIKYKSNLLNIKFVNINHIFKIGICRNFNDENFSKSKVNFLK